MGAAPTLVMSSLIRARSSRTPFFSSAVCAVTASRLLWAVLRAELSFSTCCDAYAAASAACFAFWSESW